MKISNRLKTIGDFVPDNASIIDVGADHGLLEKYLLETKNIKNILAIENKIGPFNTLKSNVETLPHVKCLLSDGIEDITEDIDTIVIAGMGGNLILDILSKHPSKLKNVQHIIVDAHKDIELVRRGISNLGFTIAEEKITYENNIYYFIIHFVKGTKTLADIEYEFGYNIKSDPMFEKYQNEELKRLLFVLIKQKNAHRIDNESVKKLQDKIERLEQI